MDPVLGPRPAAPPPNEDALSPAQRRVLRALREQARPTGLGELAAAAELHPNTVREHLEALQAAGAVRRQPARPVGRGRPAWLYEPTRPSRGVAGLGVAEYVGLVSSMAGALAEASTDPRSAGVAAGLRWGSELVAQVPAPTQTPTATTTTENPGENPSDTPAETTAETARRQVVVLLEDLGFAPERDPQTGPQTTTVRLTQCPLLDAARAHPDIVCGVHLGIARAALQAWGAPVEGTDLAPFSDPGYCQLRLGAGSAGVD